MKKIILVLLFSASSAFAVDAEEQGRELFYQTCLGVKSQQAQGKLKAALKNVVKEKRAAFPDLPEPDLSEIAKVGVACDFEKSEMQLSMGGKTQSLKLLSWKENTYSINGTKVVWYRRADKFADNWWAIQKALAPKKSWTNLLVPEAQAGVVVGLAMLGAPVFQAWVYGTAVVAAGTTAYCMATDSRRTAGQCARDGGSMYYSVVVGPTVSAAGAVAGAVTSPLREADRRANISVIDGITCPTNGSKKITVHYVYQPPSSGRMQTVIEVDERGQAIAATWGFVGSRHYSPEQAYLYGGSRRYNVQNPVVDSMKTRAEVELHDALIERAKYFAEVCRSPRRIRHVQSQINEWRRQRNAGSGAPAPAGNTDNSISAGQTEQGH